MPVSVVVEVNRADAERVAERLQRVISPTKFRKIMRAGVSRGMRHVRRSVTESIENRVYARSTGFPNRPRTGRLKKDFRTFTKTERDDVLGIVSSSVPYALAHEKGATLRPKTAKAMLIPISQVAIYQPTARFTRNKFVKNGILWVVRGGIAMPMYALKKVAYVKKKQPFELGAREAIPKFTSAIQKTLEERI